MFDFILLLITYQLLYTLYNILFLLELHKNVDKLKKTNKIKTFIIIRFILHKC